MTRRLLVAALLSGLCGCQLPGLIGAVGQNNEREKKVEVLVVFLTGS